MKKILALLLAFAIMFSVVSPVAAENASLAKYNEAGRILEGLGLLQGDGKGNLGLDSNLKKQHMVVMISRLFGEEDKAMKFVGPNKFKDLKSQHRQDIPYITWAADKGLIEGKPDGTFGFDSMVIVQEYQTVLLRALGYEKDAKDWEMVPKLSEAYGLMKGLDAKPSAKMNRGVMASMTVNALRQEKNGENITLADFLNVTIPDEFKVDETVTVEDNNVTFKGKSSGSENLWIQIKPVSSDIKMTEILSPIALDSDGNFSYEKKDLEVGEYKYAFKSGDMLTSYKLFKITTLPFELKDVRADNLKEIHLLFTGPVDRTITSLKSNYTTTAGPIKNIKFEDNDRKIILTLEGTMTQQVKYKISAMKIRSKTGEEAVLKNFDFEAFDNTPPAISSINQLGDKGIRIYFSEPIRKAISSDFTIDGKKFNGTAKLEDNIVTLLYYSSSNSLSNGKYTLKVSSIEDFAGYKPLDSEHDFSIERDKTAPKIVNASATLDTVTIEFDEDIDPVSEKNKSIYWKSRTNKIYPSKITVSGRTVVAEFKDTFSTNSNTFYAEVEDYSGNKSNDSIDIVPVIDTTNPEVINYKVSKDGRTITVYYSKNVNGKDKKDYKIIDENKRIINIRDIEGSGIEYKLNLYSALPVGRNTLTIEGVQDNTTLKNKISPFSAEIDMKDVESPRLISSTGYANRIVLHFSKVMDIGSVTDPDNYIMTFKGRQIKLPSNSLFTPSDDGKTITILLPENIDGSKVMIGSKDNLTSIDMISLKDLSGNETEPLIINVKFDGSSTGKAKAINYYSDRPGREGILTESNIIKVRFSLPIVQASKSDFDLVGRRIDDVEVNGSNEVIIYLDDDDSTSIDDRALAIERNNKMVTSIDTGVESSTIKLYDEIAPRIKNNTSYLYVYGNEIEIPFTEALEGDGASLYGRDLEVVRLADNKLLSEDSYTTSLLSSDKSILILTINKREITSEYSVRLINNYGSNTLSYIRDRDGNLALASDRYFTDRDINKQ